MKIFVTGFQNSGTSVLCRLIGLHPDIELMLFEAFILKERVNGALQTAPREKLADVLGFDPDLHNWGEKITILHSSMENTGGTILDYIKIWKDYFSPDCKFLWVVRHPADVILGNFIRRKTCGRVKDPTRRMQCIVNAYSIGMTSLMTAITDLGIDFGFVKFENVMLNSVNSLGDLFSYIGVDSSFDTVFNLAMKDGGEKRKWFIRSEKAFNYSENTVTEHLRNVFPGIDYEIDILNDYAPGIKYGH